MGVKNSLWYSGTLWLQHICNNRWWQCYNQGTDKDTAREVRNKDGKHVPEQEDNEEKAEVEKAEMPIPTLSEAAEAGLWAPHIKPGHSTAKLSEITDIEQHLEYQCSASRIRQIKITDYLRF
jgi:hypothetical protein